MFLRRRGLGNPAAAGYRRHGLGGDMGRVLSLALLAVLVVLPASGHASTRAGGAAARPTGGAVCPAGDTVVTIADSSFTPNFLQIDPGTTVCWTYPSGFTIHTATSDDGTSFNSGNIGVGAIYEHTFPDAG